MCGVQPVISLQNICKRFPGVIALSNVSIDFYAGKVHILLGENGAGKSTLIKIISGVYKKDSGEMMYNGKNVQFKDPRQAMNNGIAVIHQELSVVADLTVAENIFLGREPRVGNSWFVDKQKLLRDTQELLQQLCQNIDPNALVKHLSTAQRQMVEIAKAISQQAKVVIMDEPTSSLSEHEVGALFGMIKQLTQQGVAVIYISHRLNEFDQIGDTITIMRDGAVIETTALCHLTQQQMITKTVGRDIEMLFPKGGATVGAPVLEVDNISRKGAFSNISLTVHAGEVVGIAGLVGAGRTEVLRGIFGADRLHNGAIRVFGKAACFRSPKDAIQMEMALVPEDRRGQGLLLQKSIAQNISLPSLPRLARMGFISGPKETAAGVQYSQKLRVHPSDAKLACHKLSGGNQQKVVLARWTFANVRILLLDEPTRGIDIGAKQEIYELIHEFAQQGKGILIVSSELPELLGICDRIYVMREKQMVGELARKDFSEEAIITMASIHA